MSGSLRVRINGDDRQFTPDSTVADAVTLLGAPSSGIAVALDGEVVPRAGWAQTRLHDGAVLEVLTAVQGG